MSTLLVTLTAAAVALSGTPPTQPVPAQPLPMLSLRTAQPAPEAAPPPTAAPPAVTAPAHAPVAAEPAMAPAAPEPDPADALAPVTPQPDPAEALGPAPGDPAAAVDPPAPVIHVTVEPPPTPAPQPAPPPRVTAGRGLLVTGGVMMGLGGASLLFVAAPSALIRNSALRRAEDDNILSVQTREARYDRARRADDTMEAGFWIGVPLLATGAALLVTGAVVRGTARNRHNRQHRVAATPGGIAVRF